MTIACFRCGTRHDYLPEAEDTGFGICDECGEDAVLTFNQALDLLNDLYLNGTWDKDGYIEETLGEDYDELDFDEDY